MQTYMERFIAGRVEHVLSAEVSGRLIWCHAESSICRKSEAEIEVVVMTFLNK